MKILVTGSAGFIGHHLVKRLLKFNHVVFGVDSLNNYYSKTLKQYRNSLLSSKNYFFEEIDINNLTKIEGNFDLAINLAAQAGVRLNIKDRHLYMDSNIRGFKSFCKFCKNNNIRKAIYASSSSVYSSENNVFSEESSKLIPSSFYGKTKLHNEQYATKFCTSSNISMIGLRFFTVYGPLGRPDMAYYSFSKSLNEKNVITLFNDGKMARDMTYIDDIIDGIILSLNRLISNNCADKNEVFNLGNSKPIETAYLLQTLEEKFNIKSKIKTKEVKNEILRTHADLTKSSSILGYNPKIQFEDGIDKFVKWFKEYENLNTS